MLLQNIKGALVVADHSCCNEDSLGNQSWKALHRIGDACTPYAVTYEDYLSKNTDTLVKSTGTKT